jgi:ABC-2 type transport system permease protein
LPITASAVLLPAFLGLGGFIYYNTHVLNEFVPGDEQMDRQAEYEKAYRQYKDLKQPRITALRADVDIFPQTRNVAVRGHYRIINPHAEPIAELHLSVPQDRSHWSLDQLDFGPAERVQHDGRLGYSIYRLATPMAPGEERDFDWELAFEPQGFGNGRGQTQVVENGTFINNFGFPGFGYQEDAQLVDRNERRKRDLGEVPRMAKIDDEGAHANHYLSNDADWIEFETTVSTSADQVALAPGYLQREWTENGRRYFHYKMDAPMLPFAAWLSARWAVKKSDWNGMPIEVYHDPRHSWNVDRMIEASKKSFDYFNANFTPYQHRQFRILEFPGYSTFAQAFANTIPYSEGIGFIADLRNQDAIDYVFYVTAHEAAHQWWAHQVIGADVQGATVLSESLAQYSALMVMEQEYGPRRCASSSSTSSTTTCATAAPSGARNCRWRWWRTSSTSTTTRARWCGTRLRDAIGEDRLNAILALPAGQGLSSARPTPTRASCWPTCARAPIRSSPADRRPVREDRVLRQPRGIGQRAQARGWQVRGHPGVARAKLEADGKGKEKDRARRR